MLIILKQDGQKNLHSVQKRRDNINKHNNKLNSSQK